MVSARNSYCGPSGQLAWRREWRAWVPSTSCRNTTSAATLRTASRSSGSTKRRLSRLKPMWAFTVSTLNASMRPILPARMGRPREHAPDAPGGTRGRGWLRFRSAEQVGLRGGAVGIDEARQADADQAITRAARQLHARAQLAGDIGQFVQR